MNEGESMSSYAISASLMQPQVKIITYGVKYKRKELPAADFRCNCQRLDNPPGILWDFNGTSKPIQANMMQQISNDKKLFKWFQSVLGYAEAWTEHGTKNAMIPTLAFYCFGGRHRSVATAELVNRYLSNKGFVTNVNHLDIDKSNPFIKGHKHV